MYKYKILIAYDGTPYSGWQIQPNALSIQECLEKALETFLKTKTRVIGSGRTDAGVHALGQSAHFVSENLLDQRRSLYALNSLLPSDIRVKELYLVNEDFHAQYSALGKIYHYHVCTSQTVDPFLRLYRHHFPFPFSYPLLKNALTHFVGTKDFKTFANVGSTVKTTIRTIQRIEVHNQEGGFRIEFEGDGFLYKMVRNIVGTALEVATKKKSETELKDLFSAKDRRMGGMAAPAKGLFLVKVHYPDLFLQNSTNDLE